jgi:putative membrane protein
MMWWYGNGNGDGGAMSVWGYSLMTVGMVLFWGLVIFAVIAFVRHSGRGDRSGAAVRPTAEQVLAERFARGEVDEQEYRQRLDALRGGPRSVVTR